MSLQTLQRPVDEGLPHFAHGTEFFASGDL